MTVPVGVLQAIVDVFQHDILNEHVSRVRLGHTAGKVVLQSGHQSVQRPLAVDRHNLPPHLQHLELGWLESDATVITPDSTLFFLGLLVITLCGMTDVY